MKDTKEKRAFTEVEAAIYISMSRSFLRQDRMNGLRKKRTPGPKYIKKGRFIRYLREDLDEWLETNSAYSSDTFSEEAASMPMYDLYLMLLTYLLSEEINVDDFPFLAFIFEKSLLDTHQYQS